MMTLEEGYKICMSILVLWNMIVFTKFNGKILKTKHFTLMVALGLRTKADRIHSLGTMVVQTVDST